MSFNRESLSREILDLRAKQEKLRADLERIDSELLAFEGKIKSLPIEEPQALEQPPAPVLPPPLPEIKMSEPARPVEPPPLPVIPNALAAEAPPSGSAVSAAEFSTAPEVPVPATPPPPPPVPAPSGEKKSLEVKLGTYWLVRIGIVMFLAALVFAGNYAYENLGSHFGPGFKVALLYIGGFALAGVGAWLESKGGKILNFARVLFAGGLSAVYYVTYAAHYVPKLRIIESPIVAGALLLAWAGVMAAIADRRKSQTLAFLSILLAYFTSGISPVAGFTLYSNLVLTLAAVFFFIRHRWAAVSWLGLAGTYAGFGYWRVMGLVDKGGFSAAPEESPWLLLALLSGYWIIFTAAVFSKAGRGSAVANKLTFLTANNTAYYVYGCLLVAGPGIPTFWQWSMALGALLLVVSFYASRPVERDRGIENSYFAQGLVLITVGLIGYFEGHSLALVMAVESAFLFYCGVRAGSLISRLGSYATGLLAVGLETFFIGDDQPYTLGLIVLLLLFNAWHSRRSLPGLVWEKDDIRAWLFSLGAAWLILIGTGRHAEASHLPMLYSAEALLLPLLFWLLRMREAFVLSQALSLAALGAWMYLGWDEYGRIGLKNHLAVLLTVLLLGHAWKWAPHGFHRFIAAGWQVVYGLAVVLVLAGWILPEKSNADAVWIMLLLSFAILGYGVFTKAHYLAAWGQVFLWAAAFVGLNLPNGDFWNAILALLPVCGLVAMRQVLRRLRAAMEAKAALHTALNWINALYLLATFVFAFVWLGDYLPDEWRAGAFLLAGFATFMAHSFLRPLPGSVEAWMQLGFAALYYLFGWSLFVFDGEANFFSLLGLLTLPAAELHARARGNLSQWPRALLMLAGVSGLFFFVSRFTSAYLNSSYLAAAWALYAGLVLAFGFASKHKWYRCAGLVLLGLAIGRVAVVDIWRFDAIYRIISLFVLSGMAIGLGFLYTKFQDKMKEWL